MRRLFASPWWHDFKLLQKKNPFFGLRFESRLCVSSTRVEPTRIHQPPGMKNMSCWTFRRGSGCQAVALQVCSAWKISTDDSTAGKYSLKKPTALSPQANFASHSVILYWRYPHSAKGPWNKSLNCIFPIRYVIPKSLKVGHWLNIKSKTTTLIAFLIDALKWPYSSLFNGF